jgi:hypothetical protein
VSDQISYPYKTTGKIIVGYCMFQPSYVSKLEDTRFCIEL